MRESLSPVYPARNPVFMGECKSCGKPKESPDLLAVEDGKTQKQYVCTKCAFTFYGYSLSQVSASQIERDARELKAYGSLF